MNRPSGGTERYDANDLGVFALALPTPEPAMWVPVAVCLLFAAVRGCRRFRRPHEFRIMEAYVRIGV